METTAHISRTGKQFAFHLSIYIHSEMRCTKYAIAHYTSDNELYDFLIFKVVSYQITSVNLNCLDFIHSFMYFMESDCKR